MCTLSHSISIFSARKAPVTDQKGLDLAEMTIQCNGVGVPGAINVVELCARCTQGLKIISDEACVRFIARPIKFNGTHIERKIKPYPRGAFVNLSRALLI